MMRIGLIQVDGNLPNLALMKLSAWHKKRGDSITLMYGNTVSTRLIKFDKVYISCIFEENKEKAELLKKQFANAELGGIGVNNLRLSEEIEHIMPDYETFDCNFSLGFTTRGCIRNCYFCKVPKHEGKIKINSDIYEFWNKKHTEILLLDNNILAMPNHFKNIARQLQDNNLSVDFNQGLDHRLLTPELCSVLLDLRHMKEIRFAFDDIAYISSVTKALKMLKEAGLKDWQSRWYLYIGEKDTFDTAFERMRILKEAKQSVYVMRDRKVYNNPEYIALASWGNTMGAFKLASLNEVLAKSERMKSYKHIFNRDFAKSQRKLNDY